MSISQKQSLNLDEIITISFNIIKTHWLKFLILGTITLLPVFIFVPFLNFNALINDMPETYRILIQSKQDFNFILPLYLIMFISSLLLPLTFVSYAKIVEDCSKNERPDILRSLKFALNRYLPVLFTSLLLGVVFIIAYLLLVIPGIVLFYYSYFTILIVGLRGKFAFEALRESLRLTYNNWWKIVGYSIVFGFIVGLPAMLIYYSSFLVLNYTFLLYLIIFLYLLISQFQYVFQTVFFIKLESITNYNTTLLNYNKSTQESEPLQEENNFEQ